MGGGTTDIAIFRDDGADQHAGARHGRQSSLATMWRWRSARSYETAEALKTALRQRDARARGRRRVRSGRRSSARRSERNFSRRFICYSARGARRPRCSRSSATGWSRPATSAKLPAGLVLTGGSSQLPGMVELGRTILQMPVRVGSPQPSLPITGLSRGLLVAHLRHQRGPAALGAAQG